eukprot:GHUV01021355.1.p1 GENE.GHUV01021355.1~~GHUV01021355.1.p1  ORF type:complete len:100 (-),score=16.25 GHUV01021355.1:767-1066(-)
MRPLNYTHRLSHTHPRRASPNSVSPSQLCPARQQPSALHDLQLCAVYAALAALPHEASTTGGLPTLLLLLMHCCQSLACPSPTTPVAQLHISLYLWGSN